MNLWLLRSWNSFVSAAQMATWFCNGCRSLFIDWNYQSLSEILYFFPSRHNKRLNCIHCHIGKCFSGFSYSQVFQLHFISYWDIFSKQIIFHLCSLEMSFIHNYIPTQLQCTEWHWLFSNQVVEEKKCNILWTISKLKNLLAEFPQCYILITPLLAVSSDTVYQHREI